MTKEQIIARLKANGNPSIFEEAMLKLIVDMEKRTKELERKLVLQDELLAPREVDHEG